MPIFTLTIQLGNEAMSTGDDVAEALRAVAGKLVDIEFSGKIRDANGNTVGDYSLTGDRD